MDSEGDRVQEMCEMYLVVDAKCVLHLVYSVCHTDTQSL